MQVGYVGGCTGYAGQGAGLFMAGGFTSYEACPAAAVQVRQSLALPACGL